MLDIQWNREIQ